MALFRRSSVRYGRTPEPETPYQRAAQAWDARLALEPPLPPGARAAAMRRVNPAIIPRNHQIERAIGAAVGEGDFAPFTALSIALERPYDEVDARTAEYARPPAPEERVTRTFCGT